MENEGTRVKIPRLPPVLDRLPLSVVLSAFYSELMVLLPGQTFYCLVNVHSRRSAKPRIQSWRTFVWILLSRKGRQERKHVRFASNIKYQRIPDGLFEMLEMLLFISCREKDLEF
eukprot:868335_1